MEPIDYLDLALPAGPAPGRLRPEQVPTEEKILQARRGIVSLQARMTLCSLSEVTRGRLGVALSPEERAIAIAWLRFAGRQGKLAEEAGAPRELLKDVLDKDLALGQAAAGAELLAQTTERGTRLLGAALTESADAVTDWVEERLGDPRADRQEGRTLRIQLGALVQLRQRDGAAAQARRDKKALQRTRLQAALQAGAARARRHKALARIETAARADEEDGR